MLQRLPQSHKQAGNTALHVLLAILVVAAVGLIGWRIARHQKATTTAQVPSTAVSSTTTSTAPASTTLSPGTDNNSLSDDLTTISSSMNQSAKDSTSLSNALNDQQNEIAVPTN